MPGTQRIPRRVVVVGAGLAGLSAAMHLRGRGCDVVVIDRQDRPGGVCHELVIDGVCHDSGPTVLTMPSLLASPFASLGESLDDRLALTRLDPAYRAVFADGSHIEVGDTIDKTATSIENACGSEEAERFAQFAEHCARLFEIVFEPFMRRSFDTPLGLVGRPLVDLLRAGGFRSMGSQVRAMLHDERTRRLVSFQALYAGVPPARARALYNVITYMDVVAGVYAPRGGMAAIPAAMHDALTAHGVEIHLSATAHSVVLVQGRATGVLTDAGVIGADAVVLAVDPLQARRMLGLQPLRRPLHRSPSCIVVHAQLPADAPGIDAHHTIHFGHEWERTFREIIDEGLPMSDPSILLSTPAATDPALSTTGRQPAYVLLPCPNLDRGPINDSAVSRAVEAGLRRLNERGVPLSHDQIVEVVGPADWRARGMPAGTPFSLAHTFAQTGPFRPRNRVGGIGNVALAGAGTVPGVGVPTTLVSGELAARRLLEEPA